MRFISASNAFDKDFVETFHIYCLWNLGWVIKKKWTIIYQPGLETYMYVLGNYSVYFQQITTKM